MISIISINCSTSEIESTTQSWADTIYAKVKASEAEIEKEENELKLNRTRLENNKQIQSPVYPTDVIELNVGGEMIATSRQTLTKIPTSTLSMLFNGRWEHALPVDDHGNIRFDFNPTLFRHLLHQLQILDSNNAIKLHPPSQSSLVEPFKKMLRKLHLQQLSSSEKKQVITFDVGGQMITNRRTTFATVSNSTFDTVVPPSTTMHFINGSDAFIDYDPKLFRHLINQLRAELFTNISYSGLESYDEKISFKEMLTDLSIYRK